MINCLAIMDGWQGACKPKLVPMHAVCARHNSVFVGM
jgi:hypothetical protein